MKTVTIPSLDSEALAKIRAEEQRYSEVMAALNAGDAGPWVKLHRDEYRWPICLGWNDENEPIIECRSRDTADVLRSYSQQQRQSILAFLQEERKETFRRAEEAQKALPFVSLKSRGKLTVTTWIDNYWVRDTEFKGLRASRRGYERAEALFALPQFGCNEWLIEKILAEIIRQGRDIEDEKSDDAQVERGFVQAIAEILQECHDHAPWIISKVLKSNEDRWNTWLRPAVEEDEKAASARARNAAKARWQKAKAPRRKRPRATTRRAAPLKKAA
jgi:23S rRNA maturation mini-RNase III